MISLNAVTKRFGSITAVDAVSYTVEKGEYFALLGPNGAGKTTIVRMLLGLSFPDTGTVMIDGVAAQDQRARKGIGYLAEQHRIPPYLSGREYLLRHCGLIGMSHPDAKKEVDRMLEIVGMKGWDRQKASTYSKGMVQRIGLSAAMMGKPKLLILDEPVSGLDPLGIRDVRKILEDMRQDNVTIVLNSHFLSEVEKTCNTVAIMHKGKIVVKDSISAIVKEHETLEDVFIRYVEHTHE
jgi:ABC-2 type transport system ATP-binding protein